MLLWTLIEVLEGVIFFVLLQYLLIFFPRMQQVTDASSVLSEDWGKLSELVEESTSSADKVPTSLTKIWKE